MKRKNYNIDDFLLDLKRKTLRVDNPVNDDYYLQTRAHPLFEYISHMERDSNDKIKNEMIFIAENLKQNVIQSQLISDHQMSPAEVRDMQQYIEASEEITSIHQLLDLIVSEMVYKCARALWDSAKNDCFEAGKEKETNTLMTSQIPRAQCGDCSRVGNL